MNAGAGDKQREMNETQQRDGRKEGRRRAKTRARDPFSRRKKSFGGGLTVGWGFGEPGGGELSSHLSARSYHLDQRGT